MEKNIAFYKVKLSSQFLDWSSHNTEEKENDFWVYETIAALKVLIYLKDK